MKNDKKALITGINGQDGSYLTELLLEKGYKVYGIKRRQSQINTSRIDHLYEQEDLREKRLFLRYGDMTDALNLQSVISDSKSVL